MAGGGAKTWASKNHNLPAPRSAMSRHITARLIYVALLAISSFTAQAKEVVTTHNNLNLNARLDLAAGKTIEDSITRPYGCSVKY